MGESLNLAEERVAREQQLSGVSSPAVAFAIFGGQRLMKKTGGGLECQGCLDLAIGERPRWTKAVWDGVVGAGVGFTA